MYECGLCAWRTASFQLVKHNEILLTSPRPTPKVQSHIISSSSIHPSTIIPLHHHLLNNTVFFHPLYLKAPTHHHRSIVRSHDFPLVRLLIDIKHKKKKETLLHPPTHVLNDSCFLKRSCCWWPPWPSYCSFFRLVVLSDCVRESACACAIGEPSSLVG